MPDADIKKPNLFIIGAPKSGTSALSAYLREHPDIFFSEPKELYYFNTDFSKNFRKYLKEDEYLNVFRGAAKYKAVGEGSVHYLQSKEAVPNILKFNPDAKFIVMARNPVDSARSMHAHLFHKVAKENVRDFKEAWRLREERHKGKNIPASCPDPKILHYGEMFKLGEQLERLYKHAPKEKVLVIFFDDFKQDTRREYKRVLDFLGVEDDDREEFPVMNKSVSVESDAALKSYRTIGVLAKIKTALGIRKRFGILRFIQSIIKKFVPRKSEKQELDPAFKKELIEYFSADIGKLSELTNRDLSHWKRV